MLAKYAIAGLAGSALLASVAFAQSPSYVCKHRQGDDGRTSGRVRHRVVEG